MELQERVSGIIAALKDAYPTQSARCNTKRTMS